MEPVYTHWLDDVPKLGERLEAIRDEAKRHFLAGDPILACRHGEAHCRSIEGAFHHLIAEDHYKQLDPIERFLLLASPWVLYMYWDQVIQDIEKTRGVLTDDRIHELVLQRLDHTYAKAVQLMPGELKVFRDMITFHAASENIEACPAEERLTASPVRVRTALLTGYLRLADAIHPCECGGPRTLLPFFEPWNPRELFHWLKDRLQLRITPDFHSSALRMSFNTHLVTDNEIIDWCVRHLTLEVSPLKTTMGAARISYYLKVEKHVGVQGQPLPCERQDAARACAEFGLAFPPNAGALVKIFLQNIERVAHDRTADEHQVDEAIEELYDLIGIAQRASKLRPCHVGLHKDIQLCELKLGEHLPLVDKLSQLGQWASMRQRQNQDNVERVASNAITRLSQFSRYLVFGKSDTVVLALYRSLNSSCYTQLT